MHIEGAWDRHRIDILYRMLSQVASRENLISHVLVVLYANTRRVAPTVGPEKTRATSGLLLVSDYKSTSQQRER